MESQVNLSNGDFIRTEGGNVGYASDAWFNVHLHPLCGSLVRYRNERGLEPPAVPEPASSRSWSRTAGTYGCILFAAALGEGVMARRTITPLSKEHEPSIADGSFVGKNKKGSEPILFGTILAAVRSDRLSFFLFYLAQLLW